MNGKLPQGWIVQKLLDIAPLVPTGVPEFAGEVEYFSTGSIQGTMHSPEGRFSFLKRPTRANRWTLDGDVLQARMQGTDKTLLVNNNMVGRLFSTGFLQLRPNNQVCDVRFLYHYLSSKQFLDERDSFATGSTQVALTDTGARKLSIPLPPFFEQRRIVAKLEKLLEKVESCRTRLEKISALLKRFRQSVLAAACSGRLTADWRDQMSNPEEWKSKELFEISERIQIGPFGTQLHKSDYISNGIPLINPTHIQGYKIKNDLEFSVSKTKCKELDKYILQENDIILGRRGEMGRCAFISQKENGWLCGTGSLFVRPKSCVHPLFLFLILRNGETKAFLENESKGTTMNNLNLSILKRVPVPIPPLPEQHEIVRRVEELFAFADRIEDRYQTAKAQVDKLTQSILAKAFRGELVSQDPNDEPAIKIPERILR